MTYTLIGGYGFVGRNVARQLTTAGAEFRLVGRGDPLPREKMGRVIYTAGVSADFRSRPLATIESHVCLLRHILEAGNFSSLVYLSSARLYRHGVQKSGPFREDTPLLIDVTNPDQHYDVSKLAGESLCLHSGRKNVTVARLSNVFGGDLTSENFLTQVLRDAVAGREVVLLSDAESAKDYVWVEDVAQAVIALSQLADETSLPESAPRIYNIASGRTTRHRDLMEAIAARTGCAWRVAANAPLIRDREISIERLQGVMAFSPRQVLDHMDDLIACFEEGLAL